MSALATVAAAGAAVALAAALEELDAAGALDGASSSGRLGRVAPREHVTAISGTGRQVVVGVVAATLALAVASVGVALVVGPSAVAASMLRGRRARRRQARACELGVPALARVLADALRGGASVRGALVGAAEDRSIGAALRAVLVRHAGALTAGAPLRSALRSLSGEGGPALRLLCGTVALHIDAGGRLSFELERLATAADDARRVEEDRIAATAQARATLRVVAALPLLALVGAQLASPAFLATVAANPIALALLLLGLTLEVVAFLAARAIVGTGR